jgi:hypothetical protein
MGLGGLAALDTALHGAGAHQPDIMTGPGRRTRPVLRAGADFDTDQPGRQAQEERSIRLRRT